MSVLRALLFGLAWSVATAVVPAQAGEAAPAAALAGEFHLDGVMETGSGLRLQEDGTFEWYFSYGALDLYARGRWSPAGDGVDLVPTEFQAPPQYPQGRFSRMHLRQDGAALVPGWPWDMDDFRKGVERGSYDRIDE